MAAKRKAGGKVGVTNRNQLRQLKRAGLVDDPAKKPKKPPAPKTSWPKTGRPKRRR